MAGTATDRPDSLGVAVAEADPGWAEYLRQHPQASIYHESAWGSLMARAYGNQPFYLTATREGRIVGLLQLVWQRSALFGSRLCSTPYFDAAGILADDDAAGTALLCRARLLMSEVGATSVELRQLRPLDPDLPTRSDKVTFLLDLPADSKAMWEGLRTKVRTKIRKAQRQNFEIVHGTTELLDEFFRLYVRGMRDLGSPPHSKRFFQLILEHFPGSARIFVVRGDAGVAAVSLTLSDRLAFRVPWSASDPQARRVGANRILFWSMLAFASDQHAEKFDFGRSSLDSGTHEFKSEWVPEMVPLHWSYILAQGTDMPDLRPDSPRYRLLVAVWKKLPLPLAAWLGPHIVSKLS